MVQEMGFIYNKNKQNKTKLPRRGKTGQLARQDKTRQETFDDELAQDFFWCFYGDLAKKKVHLPPPTDLECGVHIEKKTKIKTPRLYLWFLCFFRYLNNISYTLDCLDPFPKNTLKKYYQLSTFLILALTETSPFHMQNTQKEYASLFLTVHICHTFQFMLTYFIKTMPYVQFLVLK